MTLLDHLHYILVINADREWAAFPSRPQPSWRATLAGGSCATAAAGPLAVTEALLGPAAALPRAFASCSPCDLRFRPMSCGIRACSAAAVIAAAAADGAASGLLRRAGALPPAAGASAAAAALPSGTAPPLVVAPRLLAMRALLRRPSPASATAAAEGAQAAWTASAADGSAIAAAAGTAAAAAGASDSAAGAAAAAASVGRGAAGERQASRKAALPGVILEKTYAMKPRPLPHMLTCRQRSADCTVGTRWPTGS